MEEGKVLFGTVGERYTPPKVDFCAKAKERYGITQDFKETGYIMADGTMLDFSGRNEAVGYNNIHQGGKPPFVPKPGEPDYLKGQRNTDHRDVSKIVPGIDEQWDKMTTFMRECQAIRVLGTSLSRWHDLPIHVEGGDTHINFVENTTPKQDELLRQFTKEKVFVEIADKDGHVECFKDFPDFTVSRLKMLIARCHDKMHPEA
jgi:hypothetical protein